LDQPTTSFASQDQPDQWLCCDFKDRRIELTNYCIAAKVDGFALRSWVVEGSEDGATWIVLDQRQDRTTMMPSFASNYDFPGRG
jgi:hypothetical protein